VLRPTRHKINPKAYRSYKNSGSFLTHAKVHKANFIRYVPRNQWKPRNIENIETVGTRQQPIHLWYNLWELCASWMSQARLLHHAEEHRCCYTLPEDDGCEMHRWKHSHFCYGSICQLCCTICIKFADSRDQLDYHWETYQ